MPGKGGLVPGERRFAPRLAVLGPVALGPPGALHPLGARPARALLALVAARQPLDLEALAEAVWGEDRPSSHRAALHVHLGTLRRTLEPLGAQIVRRGEAYQLDRGAAEVDAELAQDLLEAARASNDPAAAIALVDEALALWRGTPFTVEDEAVVPTAAHHLESVRRDAEELRIELVLQTGDAAAAEAAAVRAVEAEPLREHRWGQLLRARYLAGRTGDALATFQEARTALIDALGIEPGPELRDLEAAALTHDVERLRLPVAPPDVLVPLPPASGELVGRDEALERAAATVTSSRRLTVLGPPGVGKSQFAVTLARLLDADAAWIDVEVGIDGRAIVDWARRRPDGVLVLDGAEHEPGAVTGTMREVGRVSPSVAVIATSNSPLPADVPVEVLSPLRLPEVDADDEDVEASPAVMALRSALRELAPATALSTSDAAALARHMGGLPLALRLAAAAARALPVAALLERPASGTGDDVDRGTRAVLDLVPATARDAFADLSVIGGTFDLDVAAGVTGLAATPLTEVMVALVDHGLVQARPDQPEPFVVLEPLRAVGERLLAAAGTEDDVRTRASDACLTRARRLAEQASRGEPTDLEARLRTDLPHHRQALAHLARRRDAERALALVCQLELPLYALGWWKERAELFDQALAIPGPPSSLRARAHALRARPGPLHLTDPDEAARAEDMAAALGHASLQAFARFVRALYLLWAGRHAEAAELFQGAQQVFEEEGHGFLACDAQKFFGVALVLDGQADLGLGLQRLALARLRRDHPSPFHAAHALAWLGHCQRFLGDDEAALADWSESRSLAGQVHNQATAVHVAIGLGELAVERDDLAGALDRTAEALDLVASGNAWSYEPWAWTLAVRTHLAGGDHAAAVASGRRALHDIDRVPSGETVRLATELAALALAADEPVVAARLLGVATTTVDRRVLPFVPPSEPVRRAALTASVRDRLGDDADDHLAAGGRGTLAEAAGRLLAA